MNKNKLPKIPSKLIRLALKNLQKCEKDVRYKVNMKYCHNVVFDVVKETICYVNLAGATMAKSLKINPIIRTKPLNFQFTKEQQKSLIALDYIGDGYICIGLHYLDLKFHNEFNSISFVKYSDNVKKYYSNLYKIISILESKGL